MSKHSSLNLSEVGDVVDILRSFECDQKLHVIVELELEPLRGDVQLVMRAEAWDYDPALVDRRLLASVSVGCSTTNLRHLRDALSHLLYALDFKLVLIAEQGSKQP